MFPLELLNQKDRKAGEGEEKREEAKASNCLWIG
jgi:hypothetical protein